MFHDCLTCSSSKSSIIVDRGQGKSRNTLPPPPPPPPYERIEGLTKPGSFCKYRRALYLYCFRPFVVRSCLELFCFLSFVSFVLRHLCSGTHRRNPKPSLPRTQSYFEGTRITSSRRTGICSLKGRSKVFSNDSERNGAVVIFLIHNRD